MSITVKRAEGYVDFCEDLSLRADWEDAVERLDAAKRRGSDRLVDTAVVDAANEVREYEARMDAVTVRVRIHGLSRKLWQEIATAHPARPDNEQDQVYNVNVSTFFDEVAKVSIFAAVEKVSGQPRDFDPKTEWVPLADEMTNGQYGEFVDKFLELNKGVVGVPFSRAASLLTLKSEQK